MAITNLNHVVFYTRSARRSAEFYGRVLDFEIVIEDDRNFVMRHRNDEQDPI